MTLIEKCLLPRKYTIIHYTKTYFLQFPETILNIHIQNLKQYHKPDIWQLHNFYCHFNINNNLYIPPLPNVYSNGRMCLSDGEITGNSTEELINNCLYRFYNSKYTEYRTAILVEYSRLWNIKSSDDLILNHWENNNIYELPLLTLNWGKI